MMIHVCGSFPSITKKTDGLILWEGLEGINIALCTTYRHERPILLCPVVCLLFKIMEFESHCCTNPCTHLFQLKWFYAATEQKHAARSHRHIALTMKSLRAVFTQPRTLTQPSPHSIPCFHCISRPTLVFSLCHSLLVSDSGVPLIMVGRQTVCHLHARGPQQSSTPLFGAPFLTRCRRKRPGLYCTSVPFSTLRSKCCSQRPYRKVQPK